MQLNMLLAEIADGPRLRCAPEKKVSRDELAHDETMIRIKNVPPSSTHLEISSDKDVGGYHGCAVTAVHA